MTYIEQAIKKAEEVGYIVGINGEKTSPDKDGDVFYYWSKELILFDPDFWRTLGKALGWTENFKESDGSVYNEWIIKWHRFIDHLAEGKEEEEFFKELLKTTKVEPLTK